MQIDHRHPAVQTDLLQWGCWILEVVSPVTMLSPFSISFHQTTNATGFRLDAIKHIDRKFLLRFVGRFCKISQLPVPLLTIDTQLQSVRVQSGISKMFAVCVSTSAIHSQ